MGDGLTLLVNGKSHTLEHAQPSASLAEVLQALALRADRIAVELNGELAPRTGWAEQPVKSGDKLEIVHFVGGGVQEAAKQN